MPGAGIQVQSLEPKLEKLGKSRSNSRNFQTFQLKNLQVARDEAAL